MKIKNIIMLTILLLISIFMIGCDNTAKPTTTPSGTAAGILPTPKTVLYQGDNITGAPVANIGTLDAPTGRTATYVIAAANSTDKIKAQADLVCSSLSPQDTWNTVLTELALLGRGKIVVLPGTYVFSDAVISTGDNIDIEGVGNPLITITDGSWTAFTLYPDASMIATKKAALILSGSDNCKVTGLNIDGDGFTHTQGQDACGILVHNCTNINISNNTIKNIWPDEYGVSGRGPYEDTVGETTVNLRYNGILAMLSSNITIAENTIEACVYEGIGARIGVDNIKFINNIVSNCDEGFQASPGYGGDTADEIDSEDYYARNVLYDGNHAFNVHGGMACHATESFCVNNIFEIDGTDTVDSRTMGIYFGVNSGNCLADGNYIKSSARGTGIFSETARNVISNNIIDDCPTAGIRVQQNGRVEINGNRIYNCGRGVYLYDPTGLDLAFIRVDSNLIDLCTYHGIHGVYLSSCSFVSNTVINSGQDANLTYDNIRLDDIQNCSIDGNTIYASSGLTNKTKYGINVTNSSHFSGDQFNSIQNNNLRQAGNTSILIDAYNNDNIHGNTDYIHRGETRTLKGYLTAGTAGTITSIPNPFGQTVRVVNVLIKNITADTDAPNIDTGVGASATTSYSTIFDDLPGETTGYYLSTNGVPGAHTVPIDWSSDNYLNFSINDNDGSSLYANYIITIMGN